MEKIFLKITRPKHNSLLVRTRYLLNLSQTVTPKSLYTLVGCDPLYRREHYYKYNAVRGET